MKTGNDIKLRNLNNKEILFQVAGGGIEQGSVVFLDEKEKKLSVVWLYGYKSYTDDIDASQVVAMPDECGIIQEIGQFRFKGIDLRGKKW